MGDQSVDVVEVWGPGGHDVLMGRKAQCELLAAELRECLSIAEKEIAYWRERGADGQFASENIAHAIRKRLATVEGES